MPELEQQSLYDRIDVFEFPFSSSNQEYLGVQIPVFQCPSDPNGDAIHTSETLDNVQLSHTNYIGSLSAGPSRGMFPFDRGLRIAEVTGGTANTLFVGERGVIDDGATTYGWWAWGAGTNVAPTQPLKPGHTNDPDAAIHWWSYHPGGVYFLLVDGSVQFISYDIDAELFQALGSRDSGDVASL